MPETAVLDLAATFGEATIAFKAAHEARLHAAELLGRIEHALDGRRDAPKVIPGLPITFAIPICASAKDIREFLLGEHDEQDIEGLASDFADMAALVEAALHRVKVKEGNDAMDTWARLEQDDG